MSPGERVRAWRQIRGLSYRKLASLAGVHYSALYQIEKGTRSLKFEEAERIAGALGITIGEFNGEPSPSVEAGG